MNKQLTWRTIKALHQLYHERKTKAKISDHPYIKHLLSYPNRCLEYSRSGTNKIIVPTKHFNDEYIKQEIEELYNEYEQFLTNNDLLTTQSNYSEFEIRSLIVLKNSGEILNELKTKIEKGQESRKGISNLYFKAAKHIQKGSALESAVLKIIGINEFPQNENLGFYKIPCLNPKCIILCENMYFLTLNLARQKNVELWCAGGNNIKPFENISKIDLPIYYLCDWDYDGLKIYESIASLIEKIENKKSGLELISPNGKSESIIFTDDYHRSKWKSEIVFSGLTADKYSNTQQNLINELILNNEWIEEESNDIITIIDSILCI